MSQEYLILQLKSLLQDEKNTLANLANFVAFLYASMHKINWLGFYFLEPSSQDLVVGIFQGKVACSRLKKGLGVCQMAVHKQETIVVDNVQQFAGHIACDPTSVAELVVPIWYNHAIVAVLDLDSPMQSRFKTTDILLVENAVETLQHSIKWSKLLQLYD